jgi:hypothetical protein
LKVLLHNFSKIKRQNEVTKTVESKDFLNILLNDPYLWLMDPDPQHCKKVIVKIPHKIYSEPGWSRRCISDLRLRGAGVGAERNHFGPVTLLITMASPAPQHCLKDIPATRERAVPVCPALAVLPTR